VTRVAVVTGAGGGIGGSICDDLEATGWRVIAVDRDPVDRPGALQIDIGDVHAVIEGLGMLERVDALVNNAALQLFKPIRDTSVEEWDALMAVNLRAPFVCLRALTERLIETQGAVVNISSVHAVATSPSIAAYAASKGGLLAFTRAAALELAPHRVRVNAVIPGAVDTPALRDGFERRHDAERSLIERTPLGRIGRPVEIAKAVAFLLDAERSGYLTGESLTVDGGVLARLSSE